MKNFKSRLYYLLQPHPNSGLKEKWVDLSLTGLILLNIFFLVLETLPELETDYHLFFWRFEVISVCIFMVEYILRLWTITVNPDYAHPLWGRLRYSITPIALIDLMAFLPFLLPFLHFDLLFIRSVRLFRLLRILKITRYVRAMKLITDVIVERAEELLISFTIMLFMLVVSSFIMYNIEHAAQPDKFTSVPATMWWAVVTLTTVGYGDVYPITPLGKVFGALTAMTGVGLFAIPTALLASGFSDKMHKKHHSNRYCPHCGKEV
ncbi:MAG: ion transporter [Chitinophagales bacterium]|nr:ion transporter [Chitinophagales bacterium]